MKKRFRVLVQIDEIRDDDPDELDPVEVRNSSLYIKIDDEEQDGLTLILLEDLAETVVAFAENNETHVEMEQ